MPWRRKPASHLQYWSGPPSTTKADGFKSILVFSCGPPELKALGYRWNGDGGPSPKAWYIDVGEDAKELAYLRAESISVTLNFCNGKSGHASMRRLGEITGSTVPAGPIGRTGGSVAGGSGTARELWSPAISSRGCRALRIDHTRGCLLWARELTQAKKCLPQKASDRNRR
jgi:hypothetical protein